MSIILMKLLINGYFFVSSKSEYTLLLEFKFQNMHFTYFHRRSYFMIAKIINRKYLYYHHLIRKSYRNLQS